MSLAATLLLEWLLGVVGTLLFVETTYLGLGFYSWCNYRPPSKDFYHLPFVISFRGAVLFMGRFFVSIFWVLFGGFKLFFLLAKSWSHFRCGFWCFRLLLGQKGCWGALVMFYWFGFFHGFILHSVSVHVFRQWFQFQFIFLFYLLYLYVIYIFREW